MDANTFHAAVLASCVVSIHAPVMDAKAETVIALNEAKFQSTRP